MNNASNPDSGLSKRDIVVVIPTHRLQLKPDESISLNNCCRMLAEYPIVILTGDNHPADVETRFGRDYPHVRIRKIEARHFRSEDSYNKMLLTSQFYELFEDYRYMLVHQLDVLIFKDELLKWCQKGYHYIGAPLRNAYDPAGILVVGNGGLSLRHVRKFVEVTKSRVFYKRLIGELPVKVGLHYLCMLGIMRWFAWLPLRRYYRAWFVWAFTALAHRPHEDGFYAWFAQNFTEEFRKPSPIEALQFAIETEPREMIRLLGGKLPFGCHDFSRYDRDFITQLAKEQGIII